MADKKVEKALYGPSTTEVALGAVLGLLVGVVCACVYLVFKPVLPVKELPKESAVGTVYYLAGRNDGAKSRAWQSKLSTFINGGGVVVNEDELNAWAASLGGAPAAAKPGPKAPANDDFLSASGLNFRIEGERLQIGQKVLLNYYGISKEVVMQATGRFARNGEAFIFAPDQVYLGSCPLHVIPGAAGKLVGALVAKQKVPDDFRAAWAKISGIAIEGGLLQVTTQP